MNSFKSHSTPCLSHSILFTGIRAINHTKFQWYSCNIFIMTLQLYSYKIHVRKIHITCAQDICNMRIMQDSWFTYRYRIPYSTESFQKYLKIVQLKNEIFHKNCEIYLQHFWDSSEITKCPLFLYMKPCWNVDEIL